ncbi:GTP-binding protein [Mycena sanguinolenta]|uniref:GTP-binding protein n=1 Tax=Mycena sanguinolenta TaxID=230812 RepID=A0A8H6X3T1_9AGAR|nr:GTP-binding protein [Mycena sanguinolenta]
MDQAIDLRSKCPHFRILVVGRANAGKTTLLKKVCNSVEDPEIFSPNGKKLDLAVVEGTAQRGEHNIENQLIFKSNRQFIFHDSRGFESGSASEIQKVKDFIAARSATSQLSDQLHAIWYCMPTDNSRPLLAADEQFFNISGAGKGTSNLFSTTGNYSNHSVTVPVIAIFTKFDGLIDQTYGELRDRGKSIPDAKNAAPERAQEILTSNFIGPLSMTKFRPSDFVRMDDMRMKETNCIDLINKTANALTDDTLRLLFVSVQQNNIDLCISNAVRLLWNSNSEDVERVVSGGISWFPHAWVPQICCF